MIVYKKIKTKIHKSTSIKSLVFLSLVILAAFFFNLPVVEAASGFFGDPDNICEFWKAIFDFGIKMAGALTMLMILIGGLFYMLAGGSSFSIMKDGEKTNVDLVKKAKDLMTGALFGMILAMLAYVAFLVLNPYLLECRIEQLSVSLDVSTCADGKTYSSQADCEKYEGDCSEKTTRCIQGQKACKASGEKVDNKSECCSGTAKTEAEGAYGTAPTLVLKCVGGPDESKKDQWCCPKATPTVDPCADVKDDKLLATEKECKEKGGKDGGKCKGTCLQSTGSATSGDSTKKSGESSNASSNTTNSSATNSSESSKEDPRKGKWCCNLSECKNTSNYKQYKGYPGHWGGIAYGSCKASNDAKGVPKSAMRYSGCGPTALADVLSGFGKSVDPWKIAQEAVSKGYRKCGSGTTGSGILNIPKDYGLKARRANWESVKKGLQQGDLVIAHAVGSSRYATSTNLFTKGGHYIVLKCYKDGKINVNDVGTSRSHRNGWISEAEVRNNVNAYFLISD